MDVAGTRTSVGESWEEYVSAYSYALVARARHIPIGFVSLDLGYGSLDNALARAPRTPIGDPSLHKYESKLQAAAKAAGAAISFRELRPGTVSLEALVTARSPAALIKYLRPLYDLWENRPRGLFGLLLRVQNPDREVALAEGVSPGGWIAYNRYMSCTSLWSFSTMRPLRLRPCPV